MGARRRSRAGDLPWLRDAPVSRRHAPIRMVERAQGHFQSGVRGDSRRAAGLARLRRFRRSLCTHPELAGRSRPRRPGHPALRAPPSLATSPDVDSSLWPARSGGDGLGVREPEARHPRATALSLARPGRCLRGRTVGGRDRDHPCCRLCGRHAAPRRTARRHRTPGPDRRSDPQLQSPGCGRSRWTCDPRTATRSSCSARTSPTR